MSRRPALFTEADLRRAGRVAKELGMEVQVLPDGAIRLYTPESVDKSKPRVEPERRIVL